MNLVQIQMRLIGAREAAAQIKAVGTSMKGMAATAKASSLSALSNLKSMLPTLASLKTAGEKTKGVGKTLTSNLSLPLAAIGGASVYAAMKWESAFAGVRKTVDATEPVFERLEAGIRQMALRIPISANELAGLAEAAGQLGIKNKNILGFTEVMANLGVATNLGAETAAQQLARFANITGMSQSNFDRLGASIVELGNNMATTESDIVAMGMRIAGAGAQVGMTEAEIMGFAAGLSSVGVEAEAGGTAISQAFLKANTAVIAGGEELQAWGELAGVTGKQFQDSFKRDAAGAMILVLENLAQMKKDGKDVSGALKTVGLTGVRAQDIMMRGSNAAGKMAEALSLSENAWEENSALTKEAEERYKTFESQLQLVKNTLYEVGIVIGSALLPPLLDMLKWLGPKIVGFAKWFENLPGPIKTVAMVLGILAIIAGPLLVLVGNMMLAFYGVGIALSWLAANPVVLVIAAIVALVGGLILAYKKVGWFREAVDSVVAFLVESLGPAFSEVKEGILDLVDVLVPLGRDIGSTISEIVTELAPVLNFFKGVFLVAFKVGLNVLKEQFLGFVQGFRGTAQVLRGILAFIKAFVTGDFRGMWSAVKMIFSGGVNVVIGTLRRITAPVRVVGGLIISALSRPWNVVKNAVSSAVNFIRSKINQIPGVIGNAKSKIGTVASGMFDGIKNALRSAINWVIDRFNSFLESLRSFKVDLPKVGPLGGGSIGIPGVPGNLPGLYSGGNFLSSGLAVVGERGPEIAEFPRGARVTPLTSKRSPGLSPLPQRDQGSNTPAYKPIIHTHVHIGAREIALAVAEVQETERAQR